MSNNNNSPILNNSHRRVMVRLMECTWEQHHISTILTLIRLDLAEQGEFDGEIDYILLDSGFQALDNNN